ncbi:uncharacterized protein N7459_005977 [Penicillium hispanicum]|uniref:uncharacterized protein n=1 Tax=Penicillium hispanicum TaxID=1080232 RepID=UPI002541AA18|nr:uncharacterized protein N7459_005977 [Penicillium hispanicum]KAJ5579992.1 hypothetical protein N7459_005977 [Penicillium hispanicum]
MDPRKQPPWEQPPTYSTTQLPPLSVWNSLTRSKTNFVPLDPEGRKVTWYACGPTVYDDAHLGHARNYVSTDILRRIMKDYFKFDVRFVMNITDVDDKIIIRGRQRHLFSEYVKEHQTVTRHVLQTAQAAYSFYIKENLRLVDSDTNPEHFASESEKVYGVVLRGGALDPERKPGDAEAKIRMHVNTVAPAAKIIAEVARRFSEELKDSTTLEGDITSDDFYDETREVYLPYLDRLRGSTVPGDAHSIFTKLTQKYEDHFMRDMRDLNVLDPDEITRVTEYGREIADFVEKIVANKFGYVTSDGSVYFDIQQFEKAGNNYARLEPWNRNNQPLQRDGEGALTTAVEKRSPDDFALWKASRPGEPSWQSMWGQGRPGWHIECSAMASSRLGSQIDIHSGGIDLAFPHHDNELAQSEAYWSNHQQWVNYFLHMGHLSIQGYKMSKSLKNFTTVRDALDRGDWTPRGLRIVFLLGGWRDGIEISEEVVKASSSWEDKLTNFFVKAKDVLSRDDQCNFGSSLNESPLSEALNVARDKIHEYFCDSFNTPKVMGTISDLISEFNAQNLRSLQPKVVDATAKWVTQIVTILGLNGTTAPDSATIGWEGTDVPDAAKAPYSELLKNFQSSISSLKPEQSTISKTILSLCDRLRDVDLFNLGIYLEDRDDMPALVRPVTRDILQAREELAQKAKQKQQEKEKQEELARQKLEKGKLSHLEMFKTNEFSAWDEDGIPTKDAEGEPVNKSRAKKLRKDWERQKKAHNAWLAANI